MRVLSASTPAVLMRPQGPPGGYPLGGWMTPLRAAGVPARRHPHNHIRSRTQGEKGREESDAVVASGATSELSEEQVKQHLVV
jgi:hypothetical protein